VSEHRWVPVRGVRTNDPVFVPSGTRDRLIYACQLDAILSVLGSK
jgi:hypothetical protein